MSTNAINNLSLLILDAFARFRHADIPVAEVGHGTDNQFWNVLLITEHKHFVFEGRRTTTDHVDIKGFEQLLRSI